MGRRFGLAFWLLTCVIFGACGPASSQSGQLAQPSAAAPSRTLVFVVRAEAPTLAGTPLVSLPVNLGSERRVFNAGLAQLDAQAEPIPYLAEALPELNTDSWRVFPDGKMETTYRLKPNLTWHDGAPASAADFVFAFRVYGAPEVSPSRLVPRTLMEDVTAPDSRTLVIRWQGPYPGAGSLSGTLIGGGAATFAPLPRHILEPQFGDHGEGLATLPFWTTEYVGMGPYKLANWEPGSSLEATAFDGHALGRPQIDRIRMIFNSDANTALATLLAGNADMPIESAVTIDQGTTLKQEWEIRGAGTVEFRPSVGRYLRLQFRPDYASPGALLDVRVRRAVAHVIDKRTINDALYAGAGTITDTWIPPTEPYYPDIEAVVPQYQFDPSQAQQLLSEAGFAKNPAGFFVGPNASRFDLEIGHLSSKVNDAEASIIGDGWRRAGLEAEETALSPTQAQDNQVLSTYRALFATSGGYGENGLGYFVSSSIPSPDNRWLGQNRGGWSNPEYNRLVAATLVTLDRTERIKQIVEAVRILNEDVGVIPLYYTPEVLAYATGLHGVNVKSTNADPTWNIYAWEWVS